MKKRGSITSHAMRSGKSRLLCEIEQWRRTSRCSVASADYLLVFRRKGDNPIQIAHPVGLLEYAGERKIPSELIQYRGWKGNQIENRYSHWIWRQYASAFWDDIRIGRVLPFKAARDSED